MSDVLILIPARHGSSRFPGKPLAKILGKPMIQRVVENCLETGFDCAAVTDDARVESFLKENALPVVRVDDQVETGSERIALALERHFADKDYRFVVNVQGDEPLLKAGLLKSLVSFHSNSVFDICTAVKERFGEERDYNNPNTVKCVLGGEDGKCLYFTRAGAPFYRDGRIKDWHQHIGLYSYRTEALKAFVALPAGRLEKAESLEQLRALENGMSIGAVLAEGELIGVDTPEDIARVEDIARIEGVLSGQKG